VIPIAEPCIGEEELIGVINAVKSGWISSKGKFIPEFEEKFASYCGAKYGVATSNGTVALHLALAALGMGERAEVIVPSLTFIATANAVRYTRATPLFVDSNPDYWGIDPARIEEAITPKTRAIIPVHLYGHPCDMDPIMDIARRHNLYVVEDAAEAHGAEYKGRRVGSFGDIGCFSFYGNKIITTGEGGMCITSDKALAEKMRILRDHGMNPSKKYWHDVVGFNYRITNLQAAVGVAQIEKLDTFIAKKREIARWYSECLHELEEKGFVKLHPEMSWARCVYWMYTILVQDGFGLSRDELMVKLEENGVETRPFFYPIHTMPPYRLTGWKTTAEELSKRGISLPTSISLSAKQVEDIATIIRKLRA
jgi:perosamine synthetase